jgi:hypothetical protein
MPIIEGQDLRPPVASYSDHRARRSLRSGLLLVPA